jgi:uncharacterized protein YbjT (DUF2867 family)
VARALRGLGRPVRALVRDPALARLPEDVEVAVGDYGEPASLSAAIAGVEGVFLMAPIPHLRAAATAVARAAADAGVSQLVLLSSLSVEARDNEHAALHEEAEAAITGSGCGWTILRGGQFMSNTLRWAPDIKARREVRPYVPNVGTAIVHPGDIAAVAAQALIDPRHQGKTYGLTGGARLSPQDCTRTISDLMGEPLRFVELSGADAERLYVEMFGDSEAVRAKLRSLRETDVPWGDVRPDVEQVLGRRPLDYREWAAENVAAFR